MLAPQQAVKFVRIDSIATPFADKDQFEYRPELGWRWLQKACFAVLGWIGAHHMAVATVFQRTPEENNDLLKSLLGQEGQWLDMLYHERDRMRIYMGPDDHADLMQLSQHLGMHAATFSGRIEICSGRDRYGEWHDIPITVVPWMQGAIIVPA